MRMHEEGSNGLLPRIQYCLWLIMMVMTLGRVHRTRAQRMRDVQTSLWVKHIA